MTRHVLDTHALYRALEAERARLGYSWRLVASQTGVSPNTFTRLRRGQRPGCDALLTLLWWLGDAPVPYATRNGDDKWPM